MRHMRHSSLWLCGLDQLHGHGARGRDTHSLTLTLGLGMRNWVYCTLSVPIPVTSCRKTWAAGARIPPTSGRDLEQDQDNPRIRPISCYPSPVHRLGVTPHSAERREREGRKDRSVLGPKLLEPDSIGPWSGRRGRL